MSSDLPIAVAFFILAGTGIVAHAWWCLSRGVYHARHLRVVRAESPIEFWFWIVLQLLFATLMVVAGLAMLVVPMVR